MIEQRFIEQSQKELDTALELMKVAKLNADNKFYNSAINRLYYACFHSVNAMLPSRGIENYKSHDGAKLLFGLNFVKTGIVDKQWGRFFTTIMQYRNDSDYDVYTIYTKKDVDEIYPQCEEFISLAIQLISSYLSVSCTDRC